jgi:hypothetical protein
VRIFVITVGEARCSSRDLSEVTRVSGGWCQDTDFASLDSRLSDVFGALW